jgi:hypothetical protein
MTTKNKQQIDWDAVYEKNRRLWLGLDEDGCAKLVDNKRARARTSRRRSTEEEPCEAITNNDVDVDGNNGNDNGNDNDNDNDGLTLKDRPFYPKNLGTPKNVIPEWYGKKHKDERVEFKSNDCFYTYSDHAKPHEMHHTSIFKCPITGELFGCGQFGDSKLYKVKKEYGQDEIDVHEIHDSDIDNENANDNENDENKVSIVWYRKCEYDTYTKCNIHFICLSMRLTIYYISTHYTLHIAHCTLHIAHYTLTHLHTYREKEGC